MGVLENRRLGKWTLRSIGIWEMGKSYVCDIRLLVANRGQLCHRGGGNNFR